jgi:hypothetical protein
VKAVTNTSEMPQELAIFPPRPRTPLRYLNHPNKKGQIMFLSRLFTLGKKSSRPAREAHPGLEELETRYVPTAALGDTYVATLYQGLLGHAADPQGLAFWSGMLTAGTSPTQVANGILGSTEYRSNQVELLYENILGRQADLVGLDYAVDGMYYNGLTFDQVKVNLLASDEFFQAAGGSNEGFLQRTYQDILNRGVDPAGDAAFGAELAQGASRGVVAQQIVTSIEAEQIKVAGFYQEILSRPADSAGLNYWTNILAHGGRDETIQSQLLGSTEFSSQLQASLNQSGINDPNAAAQQFISSTGKFKGGHPVQQPPVQPPSYGGNSDNGSTDASNPADGSTVIIDYTPPPDTTVYVDTSSSYTDTSTYVDTSSSSDSSSSVDTSSSSSDSYDYSDPSSGCDC